MDRYQKERLVSLLSSPVKFDSSLSRYTSFAIGGPAEALARVDKKSELAPLLRFLETESLPWRVIGRGTNLLVKDQGVEGVTLLLGKEFEDIVIDNSSQARGSVRVGAGYSLIGLSRKCAECGLSGLEFCSGIPGTVGGAVIMNAGAWGSEIASVLRRVYLISASGQQVFERDQLKFVYRKWLDFESYQGKAVVSEVELALEKGNTDTIKNQCQVLLEKRKAQQPTNYPSGGSFFKNPDGDSAGRLIDAAGLKGFRIGAAQVSELHGNFLVNTGGATAEEMLQLMRIVQLKVKKNSGVELEPEVHII